VLTPTPKQFIGKLSCPLAEHDGDFN